MKLLIDFGANVNAKDSELWTPLHAGMIHRVLRYGEFCYFILILIDSTAATCGHRHLVKYLIDK